MLVPFKYKTLLVFCFECGILGHGVKDCGYVSMEEKDKSEDEFPYTITLKAESNVRGKECVKLSSLTHRVVSKVFILRTLVWRNLHCSHVQLTVELLFW